MYRNNLSYTPLYRTLSQIIMVNTVLFWRSVWNKDRMMLYCYYGDYWW